ncbi:hypothetical protein A6A25_28015 [Saccharothrix sp. CB00851]|nr:hypothetical protein A6A25_28015 [Saccharothrix sp. CB00851]
MVTTALAGLVLTGCAAQPQTGTWSTGTPISPTAPVTVSSVSVPPAKLSPKGVEVLEQAKRDGARTIGLTISTERGKADEVAASLRRLGATVEATDAAIGYVRVTAPVEAVAKVTAVDGISRVDVDEPLSNIDPTP